MKTISLMVASVLLLAGLAPQQSLAETSGVAGQDASPAATQLAYQSSDQAGASGSQSFELPKALQGLKVGGVFYLAYQNGKVGQGGGTDDATTPFNQFVLNRGYLDVQKTISPMFMGRYTTDITRDGTGDWKTRIKYLYGKFSFKGNNAISGIGVEFGQVHNPWLDFEESINGFRVQGTMFLERNGIFNSADVGIVAGSDLGGQADDAYRKDVSSHYAGRWGTWQFGVYNGGGYHAPENNLNKVMEGRLTIRPLPDVAPGLQVSALGMTGKGNTVAAPDFQVFDGMVSYQSVWVTGTAQYYNGKGNSGGSAVTSSGDARKQDGYSVFGAVHVAKEHRLSVIGRYDRFDSNTDSDTNDVVKRSIVGLAYAFVGNNLVLLDYENDDHSTDGYASDQQFQASLQLVF
ncbi:MAG TPA: hypothetical protein VFH88_09710 [Candidatus Krumholzibacteria bacterium]|nr:hypothetical protein [Candidatus Krumholzibacteria bacterium]